MSKVLYFGVYETAHKSKKMYYGVDGIAREVAKAYIGVNGVARLFYQNVINISSAVVTLGPTLTYNGSSQTQTITSVVVDGVTLVAGADYTVSGNTETNAGNYTLTITGIGDYEGSISSAWSIAKLSLTKPTVSGSYTYNGSTMAATVSNMNTTYITQNGTASTATVGTYTLTFSLKDTANTQWTDGTTTNVTGSWSIAKLSLTKPTVSGSFTYNGSAKSCTVSNMNSTYITQSGTASATNAGTYTVTFTLKSTTNTQWSDGTTAAVSRTWSIAKATGSISVSPTSMTISGEVGTTKTATITYTGDGNISVASSATGVATVSRSGTTVTVTLVAEGSATITITMATGTNYTGASCTIAVTTKIPVLSYYGTITQLSTGRSGIGAATVGNYAIFAGGATGDYTQTPTTEAYDNSLTLTSLDSSHINGSSYATTTVGNYALFGGGVSRSFSSSNSAYSTVSAFDTSLTRTTATTLHANKKSLAATTIGNYAIFAGGRVLTNDDTGSTTSKVETYNKSLTKSTATSLTLAVDQFDATTVGSYALFGGGYYYNQSASESKRSAYVDAYNTSLTKSTATNLSSERYGLTAATVGGYALFAGGTNPNSGQLTSVNAYNTSLTKSIPTSLSVARLGIAATTIGGYALFSGGMPGSSSFSKTVDAYNTSLTRSAPTELSVARSGIGAATIGNYAIFAGGVGSGYPSNSYSKLAEAYQYV